MLDSLELRNFTAFKEADFTFASGLNVFVGENGTGKTHILKLAYCALKFVSEAKGAQTARMAASGGMALAEKLLFVFKPDELGHLIHRGRHGERCQVSCSIAGLDRRLAFSFDADGKNALFVDEQPVRSLDKQPVYLPTRELLTVYPGFVSLYETTHLSFDETWRDCCILLGKSLMKNGKKDKRMDKLLAPLEEAMGGRLDFDASGRFYLNVAGAKVEMHLVAEGFRKLGMIARLIANGSLADGGHLFWDEPEANLNPKIIKLVARVILLLCKSGVQVFIASHSLFLLRELYILMESEFKSVKAHFVGLHPGENGVEVEQGDSIDDIGEIDALDEELIQSDRYLDVETK